MSEIVSVTAGVLLACIAAMFKWLWDVSRDNRELSVEDALRGRIAELEDTEAYLRSLLHEVYETGVCELLGEDPDPRGIDAGPTLEERVRHEALAGKEKEVVKP